MRKTLQLLVITSLLTIFSTCAFAQFEKGDKIFHVGIGGGGYGYYGGGIAVGASYEVGIHEFISVGAQADLRFYDYGYGSYTSLPIAARGSYHYGKHFLKIDALDLYAGPALGINIDGSKYYHDSKVVIGVFAGAHYYFKPAMGVFAELSGGTNVIPAKVGLAFKF